LVPAFFAVSLATLCGALFIFSNQDAASAGATLSAAVASLANLKFMWQGNYFVLSPDAQPYLHCWSLSVEEQFYLIYPAAFLLLYWRARSVRTHVIMAVVVLSLFSCILLTYIRPEWAFYLLPTRAWELLAGGVLVASNREIRPAKFTSTIPLVGLSLIGFSIFWISEGPGFPGLVATLPVVGTTCFLLPYEKSQCLTERILSWWPLALIGRMSYSLYMWHWPIFSLVDYRFYAARPLFRLALKVSLSVIAATVCFFYIETPGRSYLNHPSRQRLAFFFLACFVVLLVPLGLFVRYANYINAEIRDVKKGGLHFNQGARNGSLVLMGDSNASMYGRTAKKVAEETGLRLTVISVAAADPLPRWDGSDDSLWSESVAVVKRERPDFLLLACNWQGRLAEHEDRLAQAVSELKPFVRVIILITQPPHLPNGASREGIRNGMRAPFIEDAAIRSSRMHFNGFVKSLQENNVVIIDVEPLLSDHQGAIRFTDDAGSQLYADAEHLSATGANLIEPNLIEIINQYLPRSNPSHPTS
jgi:peptidoglycan/LPS O-acetylase OafA/YrhL